VRGIKEALGIRRKKMIKHVIIEGDQMGNTTKSGKCETCGNHFDDVRPYGPDGSWICLECANKDPDRTFAEMLREAAENKIGEAVTVSPFAILTEGKATKH
jgi:hypothetical protein